MMLILSRQKICSIFLLFLLTPFVQALTLEENVAGFCSYNGALQNTFFGSANGLYVNLSNDAGKGINWSINVAQAGNYTLSFRYSNAGSESATQAALRINGVVVAQSLAFPKTTSWLNWTNTSSFPVALIAGINSIRLETIVASEFAMIDSLTVNGDGLTPAACSSSFLPKPSSNGLIPTPQAPVLPSVPAQSSTIDQASATPGDFEVNASGQAKYSIPIATVPGSGGMIPKISVGYSSGGSNGSLGLDWSLNAGGSISLCRQTEGQDKNAAPLTWSSEDRFCLNGIRLLVDAGYTYGAPNSQYKTEVDNFARITAVGGSVGQPDYFKVEYKDGKIDYFGVGNSKYQLVINKTLQWLLSSSEDSATNKISYIYNMDEFGQKPTLAEVRYAFDATGANPAAVILFDWEDRDDVIRGYVGGLLSYAPERLHKIESKNNNEEIRSYTFNYNQGANYTTRDQLSRLSSIDECVGVNCRNATSFVWDLPELGLKQNSGQFINSTGISTGNFRTQAFADINGDGLKDIVWLPLSNVDRTIHYAIASIDSTGKFIYTEKAFENGGQVSFNYYVNSESPILYFTDYNGDGRADLVFQESPSQQLKIYLSKPQLDGSWLLSSVPVVTIPFAGVSSLTLADVNGDGLDDIFNRNTKKVRYLLPNGGGYSPEYPVNFITPPSLVSPLCPEYLNKIRPEMGDFNGDGRMDLIVSACVPDGASTRFEYHVYLSEINSSGGVDMRFYSKLTDSSVTTWPASDSCEDADPNFSTLGKMLIIDINNDGLSDVVGGEFNCELTSYRLNTGAGFSNKSLLPNVNFSSLGNYFADYNNDGYLDIISYSGADHAFVVTNWNPVSNTYSFSTSHEVFQPQYQVEYGDYFSFQDLNGDGLMDFFVSSAHPSASAPSKQLIQVNNSNFKVKNKITKITDGLGHITKIDYEPLVSTKNYGRVKGVDNTALNNQTCRTIGISGATACWFNQNMTASVDNFYNYINNPFANLLSDNQKLEASPSYTVFNIPNGMSVVTRTTESAPSADSDGPLNVSLTDGREKYYYYEQARTQAAGRGFLGFKTFTVFDYQTGIRKVSEFRQDWPFIGVPLKIETYSANQLLSKTENSWGFAECYSALSQIVGCADNLGIQAKSQGTKSLGALKPFLAKTKTTNYYLNTTGTGGLAKVVEAKMVVDQQGNTTFKSESTGLGGAPLLLEETTNGYSYPSYSFSGMMGRLNNKIVVTTQYDALGSDSIRRESSFDYYTSGASIGLLAYEIIEPNNSSYTVRTDYVYNSLGLKVRSDITAEGQTRRSTEVEYDIRGRYIDKTFEYFTTTASLDIGTKYLSTEVIDRDKYGNATESRTYTGNLFTVSKAAVTNFGIPYFTASSLGNFSIVDAGKGVGPGNVCPSYTTVWKKITIAGGTAKIQCVDLAGRTIRDATQGFGSDQWSLIDTEYDTAGNVVYKSEPHDFSDTVRWTTYFNIDSLGRAHTIFGPTREQDGVSPTTTVVYSDNQVRTTNAKNQTRIEERNIVNQISNVQDPKGGVTHFTYDAHGNMKTMSDPNGNTTTITYDLRDRKIGMADPDKGNWLYRYNRFNELICQQDAMQQSVVQKFDVRGRLAIRSDRVSGSNCTDAGMSSTIYVNKTSYWEYDKAVNGWGKLSRIYSPTPDDSGYSKRYTYDKLGRVSETETSFDGHLNALSTHKEKTTYDQYGRVFQVFDAARNTDSFENNGVEYNYSMTGYLNAVKDAVSYGGQQKTYYAITGMDARGKITAATYGNGVSKTAAYYSDSGLAKDLTTLSPVAHVQLQHNMLEWDAIGNLTSRKETGGGTWIERYLRSRNISEDFQYDDLNRLQYWTTSGDFNASESVSYDLLDNIRTKSGNGDYLYGTQCNSANNPGPHAVCRAGSTNYRYDKNGNMLSDDSGRSMQYTLYDMLSYSSFGGQITRFNYDPERTRYKRVNQNVNGQVTTTLSLGNVEKIYYPDGSMEWKRTIAGVAIVNQKFNSLGVEQSTQEHYLHYDHLGSVSIITDAIGDVEKDFYFDPWGASRTPNSAITQWAADKPFLKANQPVTSRGFTGHEQLDEVGLIHMNGRVYDAKLARFVQADPIIQDPLKVQSLNRYSYVWNNPLNATDPSGFGRDEETGVWSPLYNGKTPDEDLDESKDGKSLFDLDSQLEFLENSRALSQAFYDAKANSASNRTGIVEIESENDHSLSWWENISSLGGSSMISWYAKPWVEFYAIRRGEPNIVAIMDQNAAESWSNIAKGLESSGYKEIASFAFSLSRTATFKANARTTVQRDGVSENFKALDDAEGPHSVYRRNATTGEITHYAEYGEPSHPSDPRKWDQKKRYDGGESPAHYNTETQQYVPAPHVHEKEAAGGVRPANVDEIPKAQ